MKNAIRVTIDRSGRFVIPKAIREEAGLRPNTPLEIRVRDGIIEIVPPARDVEIVKTGHLYVAQPADPSEPLAKETVDRAVDSVRSRRGD
jgi:AbrB family looped-hinge helix DNA binding protein